MIARHRLYIPFILGGALAWGLNEESQGAVPAGLAKMQRECLKLLHSAPGGPQYRVIINCSGTMSEWRSDGVVNSKQAQNRVVAYVSFSSLLFSTPQEFVNDTSDPLQCASYSEWQGVVTDVGLEVSCRELLNVEDLDVICTESIKEKNMADPTSVIWEKTGRTYSPCQGS